MSELVRQIAQVGQVSELIVKYNGGGMAIALGYAMGIMSAEQREELIERMKKDFGA